MEVHHIIYSVVPYRGYAVRAWSSREAVGEVERAFKGWFSPFEQALVRPGAELRAVVKSPKGVLHLARVFLGERLDEMKRSGVVSHIALIPADLAIEKRLSFSSVERAMMEYTASKGIGMGDVEPLKIDRAESSGDEDLEYLRTVVDVEAARRILSEMSKPHAKLVVIFKRDSWSRSRLAYALAKMFAIHGAAEYIIATDRPNDGVLLEFEKAALVLDKMIPLRSPLGWAVVKVAEKEAEEGAADIEKTIREIYGCKQGKNSFK
jgi:hypothetical protein